MEIADAALTAVALILCMLLAAATLSRLVGVTPDEADVHRDWDW